MRYLLHVTAVSFSGGSERTEMKTYNSTLCYIEQAHQYLMLHRIKKEQDINAGKWIGVGGKFEEGESPEECLVREVREETGFELMHYLLRGIVTFVTPAVTEYMFLYTADGFRQESTSLPPCDEGVPAWVDIDEIEELPLWEGDRIFLRLLRENAPFFSLKLQYDGGGHLLSAILDGRHLPIKEK